MKFKNLLLTSFTCIIAIDVAILFDGTWQTTRAESGGNMVVMNDAIIARSLVSPVTTLARGSFVASEHPTTGLAEIIRQNGKKYLRLDKKFTSEDGPDVFVLLHRQDAPTDYQRSSYVSLGRRQKISGKQLYRIPAGVDIAQYKSVVIWCRQFNATFGFATISPVS